MSDALVRRRDVPCLVVLLVLVLTGCGAQAAPAASVHHGELAAAEGKPCPQRLHPDANPSDYGDGTEDSATETPTLLRVQRAWVCVYAPFDLARTKSGVTIDGWRRAGDVRPVRSTDLPALKSAIDGLTPASSSRSCTADLGPRTMVVFSHDGDLTGIVVDQFGCRDVRLTDDPATTTPGAYGQTGTVGGVLDGGPAVLKAVHRRQ